MIRAAATLAALCLGVGSAAARDAVETAVIGFSAESHYFAYETYVIGDGSGSAVDDIFIIDTETGAAVAGSPFHGASLEDSATLMQIRAEVRAKAAPALARLGIAWPAVLLAANPVYEVSNNRQAVEFDRWRTTNFGASTAETAGTSEVRYRLALVATDNAGVPTGCEAEMAPFRRFRLELWPRAAAGGRTVYLEDDIPPGRGCPLDYDIDRIVAPLGDDAHPNLLMALIGVYVPGWEGTDRQVIAVPISLD
jgi:predicted secreted protein